MDDISRVAVFGTGQMGPGIALITALAGCQTTLIGRSDVSLESGRVRLDEQLRFLISHHAVSDEQGTAAQERLEWSINRKDASACDLVVESIVEHLATKQAFCVELEDILPPATIIASNTSGLRISDIASRMRHPERAVTTHFWNPPHLMPLVEVIQGEHTSPAVVERVRAFLDRCGKRPVVGRKDLPGQICNRMFQAVIREAIYLVEEGIATAEDVETAIKAGMGLRFPVYGPLEHLDLVGLELALAVQTSVLPSLCNSPEASDYLRQLISEGRTGEKAGQGFHNWIARSAAQLREERDLFLVQRLVAAQSQTGGAVGAPGPEDKE